MRAAHFIPAVEYIQANRQGLLLMKEFAVLFGDIDVYVTPSLRGGGLLITNLTGHPQVWCLVGSRRRERRIRSVL